MKNKRFILQFFVVFSILSRICNAQANAQSPEDFRIYAQVLKSDKAEFVRRIALAPMKYEEADAFRAYLIARVVCQVPSKRAEEACREIRLSDWVEPWVELGILDFRVTEKSFEIAATALEAIFVSLENSLSVGSRERVKELLVGLRIAFEQSPDLRSSREIIRIVRSQTEVLEEISLSASLNLYSVLIQDLLKWFERTHTGRVLLVEKLLKLDHDNLICRVSPKQGQIRCRAFMQKKPLIPEMILSERFDAFEKAWFNRNQWGPRFCVSDNRGQLTCGAHRSGHRDDYRRCLDGNIVRLNEVMAGTFNPEKVDQLAKIKCKSITGTEEVLYAFSGDQFVEMGRFLPAPDPNEIVSGVKEAQSISHFLGAICSINSEQRLSCEHRVNSRFGILSGRQFRFPGDGKVVRSSHSDNLCVQHSSGANRLWLCFMRVRNTDHLRVLHFADGEGEIEIRNSNGIYWLGEKSMIFVDNDGGRSDPTYRPRPRGARQVVFGGEKSFPSACFLAGTKVRCLRFGDGVEFESPLSSVKGIKKLVWNGDLLCALTDHNLACAEWGRYGLLQYQVKAPDFIRLAESSILIGTYGYGLCSYFRDKIQCLQSAQPGSKVVEITKFSSEEPFVRFVGDGQLCYQTSKRIVCHGNLDKELSTFRIE